MLGLLNKPSDRGRIFMKTIVMKFGGTSLMTVDRIKSAARIVSATAASGKQIVVVVSAMGHTTDQLIDLARLITTTAESRELDALMATGEQVSATLMAMALQELGHKSRSFNGFQAGIKTDRRFGDAIIQSINISCLKACLTSGFIPVVTGFQGVTELGETSTLGRGGSDTTAIALADAIKAERCDIFTDVDGIYSADPRIVSDAHKHDKINIAEMLELARSGAQVVNARSVEVARDRHVQVRVRSTFNPTNEGTLLTVENKSAQGFTGIAVNPNVHCIEIELHKLEFGSDRRLRTLRRRRMETRRQLCRLLRESGISAEIVSRFRPNPFRIFLAVSKENSAQALKILSGVQLPTRRMQIIEELACVSLVASEITTNHEVDAIEAMNRQGIDLLAIAWYRQRLAIFVPLAQANTAANALHMHFAKTRIAA